MRTPHPDDTFLMRICYALDVPPRMLANDIGVAYSEVLPLLDPLGQLVEQDRDETWYKIKQYVDMRYAELMAIRKELEMALQKDLTKRAARIAMQGTIGRKPPPLRRVKVIPR
jgi:hypothetical protein